MYSKVVVDRMRAGEFPASENMRDKIVELQTRCADARYVVREVMLRLRATGNESLAERLHDAEVNLTPHCDSLRAPMLDEAVSRLRTTISHGIVNFADLIADLVPLADEFASASMSVQLGVIDLLGLAHHRSSGGLGFSRQYAAAIDAFTKALPATADPKVVRHLSVLFNKARLSLDAAERAAREAAADAEWALERRFTGEPRE